MRPYSLRVFCLLAVVLVAGCGKSEVATVPVQGKLFVDDKPFGPASITFKSTKEGIPSATGTVKEDGTFTLRTYEDGDGAAEGEYDIDLLPDPMVMNAVPKVDAYRVTVTAASSSSPLDVKLKSLGKKDAAFMPPPM